MSSYSIELSKSTSSLSTLKPSRLQDIPTFHIKSLLQADVLADPDTLQQLHKSCTQKDDAVESKLKSSRTRSCRVTLDRTSPWRPPLEKADSSIVVSTDEETETYQRDISKPPSGLTQKDILDTTFEISSIKKPSQLNSTIPTTR